MSAQQFTETMARCVSSYPRDLKDTFFVMDDGELDEELRALVAGAIFYGLSSGDLLPDSAGPLGYVDDALVLRIVLRTIMERAPERGAIYLRERSELFGPLQDDLETARAFFGDLFELFEDRASTCRTLEYKGKTPTDTVTNHDDSAWLYDEVMEALLRLELDEGECLRQMRKIDTVLPRLRQRLAQKRR